MARPITSKVLQTVYHCSCGFNCVDNHDSKQKHADLVKAGFKRKKDKSTKEPFYVQVINAECDGSNHYED